MQQLNKNKMVKYFYRARHSYDKNAFMQREGIERLIQGLQANPQNICDLGCGMGQGLTVLQQAYPKAKIWGLDMSAGLLNRGDICADMEYLPFADSSIDLLFSSYALQWCDAERALSEMLRVGKKIAIASLVAPSLQELHNIFAQFNQQHRLMDFIPTQHLIEYCKKHCVRHESYNTSLSFDSAHELLRYFGSLGAANARDNNDPLTPSVYRQLCQAIDNSGTKLHFQHCLLWID